MNKSYILIFLLSKLSADEFIMLPFETKFILNQGSSTISQLGGIVEEVEDAFIHNNKVFIHFKNNTDGEVKNYTASWKDEIFYDVEEIEERDYLGWRRKIFGIRKNPLGQPYFIWSALAPLNPQEPQDRTEAYWSSNEMGSIYPSQFEYASSHSRILAFNQSGPIIGVSSISSRDEYYSLPGGSDTLFFQGDVLKSINSFYYNNWLPIPTSIVRIVDRETFPLKIHYADYKSPNSYIFTDIDKGIDRINGNIMGNYCVIENTETGQHRIYDYRSKNTVTTLPYSFQLKGVTHDQENIFISGGADNTHMVKSNGEVLEKHFIGSPSNSITLLQSNNHSVVGRTSISGQLFVSMDGSPLMQVSSRRDLKDFSKNNTIVDTFNNWLTVSPCITMVPNPHLTAEIVSGQVALSWKSSSRAIYKLQKSSNLVDWHTAVEFQPGVDGDQGAILTIESDSQHYRLLIAKSTTEW